MEDESHNGVGLFLGGVGSFLSWCRVFFCLDVFVNMGEFGNLLYMCVVTGKGRRFYVSGYFISN